MSAVPSPSAFSTFDAPRPLAGVRILSLALNLPGPAALMRCRAMGAECLKFEPPGGDPMAQYSEAAYADLHQDIEVRRADLKTAEGQAVVHAELARSDVLLTSFRPSALAKLGLGWEALQAAHPHLSQVAIVGAAGALAEIPGHDLTYQAEHGLVSGQLLPPTLYADMGGALMASEAVLQAVIAQRGEGPVPAAASRAGQTAQAGAPSSRYIEVALADAAAFLALPRAWGLTAPGAILGGQHAGYQVFACKDGRVAVAALEPHFTRRLLVAAGLPEDGDALAPSTRKALVTFFASHTRQALDELAQARDIPLHTLAESCPSH